jgi:hypothetical protein
MFGGLLIAVLNNGPLRRELPHVIRDEWGWSWCLRC